MRRAICAGCAGCAAALLLLGAAPAAADLRLEAAAGVGALAGHTSYAIGGAFTRPQGSGFVNDPLSEISFPLDVTLATLSAAGELRLPRGSLVLSGELARSVTENAGVIRDRDWTGSDPTLMTVYSESNARLDARLVDLQLQWRFLRLDGRAFGAAAGAGDAWLAIGAGYLREHLDFEGRDVQQISVYPELTGTRSGLVVEYEALHRVPYAEIASGIGFGAPAGAAVAIEARLGYSPWARADDVDDHVLRFKRAEGSCEGTAVLAALRARVTAGRFFLAGSLSRTGIEASGKQTQVRYRDSDEGPAGPIAEIEQTVRSTQTRYDVALGVRF